MLGSLVSLVRGSQGLRLPGDHDAQHEQHHCEPRPECHASCQIKLIVANLTANCGECAGDGSPYETGMAFASGIRSSTVALSGASESASREDGP